MELIGTYFDKQLRYGKDEFTAGIIKTSPWWHVQGEWPRDDDRVFWSEHVSLMQSTSSAAMK